MKLAPLTVKHIMLNPLVRSAIHTNEQQVCESGRQKPLKVDWLLFLLIVSLSVCLERLF